MTFNTRVYVPAYKLITGSLTSAILLSQLLYWQKRVKGIEFYKTNGELMEELAFSQRELRSAKDNLKRLGLITVRKGHRATNYYIVHEEALRRLLAEYVGISDKVSEPSRIP